VDVDGKVDPPLAWRIDLLEKVDACGTLADAGRDLDIPYRAAWYKLHEMEDALGGGVLIESVGERIPWRDIPGRARANEVLPHP
jgi:hypothetical protein